MLSGCSSCLSFNCVYEQYIVYRGVVNRVPDSGTPVQNPILVFIFCITFNFHNVIAR